MESLYKVTDASRHLLYQNLMPRLCDMIPIYGALSGTFSNYGVEATENALKVVRLKTGKIGGVALALDGEFHGQTSAVINLNWKTALYKRNLGLLSGSVFIFLSPVKTITLTTNRPLMRYIESVRLRLMCKI